MKSRPFTAARKAIGGRLTYANVASTLALTLALGTGTAYAANTVRSRDIVNGQVKTEDLAKNAVRSAKIANGHVKRADVAGGAIDSSKVALDSLTSDDLAASSVGQSEIATNGVGAAEIATNGVGATEIADNSIDGGEIVNGSIFGADIANGTIGSAKIANGNITGAHVANNSLTTADIAGTDSLGSISLAAGAVANGRCKQYTMTVGGSLVGQGIIVAARAALQDGVFLYGGSVLANGQGTLVVCNMSGVAMNALVNFPIRTITFG